VGWPQGLLSEIELHSEKLCELECDGFTQVASYLLARAGVEHQPVSGRLSPTHNGSALQFPPIHCWIELSGGMLMDYRVRAWLPDMPPLEVPHGLLMPANYPGFIYSRDRVIGPTSQHLYGILCLAGTAIPPELLAQLQP
jgi:hypothetical protein